MLLFFLDSTGREMGFTGDPTITLKKKSGEMDILREEDILSGGVDSTDEESSRIFSVAIKEPSSDCDPNNPIYKGCFVDDYSRDMNQGPKRYGYNQITCNQACKGYKYFALQNNGWCACGNAYSTKPQYIQKPDGECGGAAGLGGPMRNSIYETCSVDQGLILFCEQFWNRSFFNTSTILQDK